MAHHTMRHTDVTVLHSACCFSVTRLTELEGCKQCAFMLACSHTQSRHTNTDARTLAIGERTEGTQNAKSFSLLLALALLSSAYNSARILEQSTMLLFNVHLIHSASLRWMLTACAMFRPCDVYLFFTNSAVASMHPTQNSFSCSFSLHNIVSHHIIVLHQTYYRGEEWMQNYAHVTIHFTTIDISIVLCDCLGGTWIHKFH